MDKESIVGALATLLAAGAVAAGQIIGRRRSKQHPVTPPSGEVIIEAPDYQTLFRQTPCAYLILSPYLFIVDANDSYLGATMTSREAIVGRHLFEVFPDNQNDEHPDGVANLRASLERVLIQKETHEMAIQRYDVRRPKGGFEVRYWKPVNKPILGADGFVRYIIHHVVDVTDSIHHRPSRPSRP